MEFHPPMGHDPLLKHSLQCQAIYKKYFRKIVILKLVQSFRFD